MLGVWGEGGGGGRGSFCLGYCDVGVLSGADFVLIGGCNGVLSVGLSLRCIALIGCFRRQRGGDTYGMMVSWLLVDMSSLSWCMAAFFRTQFTIGLSSKRNPRCVAAIKKCYAPAGVCVTSLDAPRLLLFGVIFDYPSISRSISRSTNKHERLFQV